MNNAAPIPGNDLKRIIKLSDLDLDYSAINEPLQDLSKLAAKVAGTEISSVNLIGSLTNDRFQITDLRLIKWRGKILCANIPL